MRSKYLFFLPGLLAAPVTAQERTPPPAPGDLVIRELPVEDTFITVLASGARETLDTTGVSVSVFGRDEMDAVQGPDLTRLLERAPGVSISRNGGAGGFTGVRVRGAEAEQLLVLVDGVRVADVAAPGGGFDFANLSMGNLAKVELLRSSNSTIWGSQALGGVLAASTGGEGYSASVEYGAHDTFYGTAGFDVAAGPIDLGLHGGHFDGRGFSAAAAGSEPDGFRQTDVAGRAKVRAGEGFSLIANGRYLDARVELDGFPAPDFMLADTAEFQDTRQVFGAGGLEYASRALDVRAFYSFAETERANFDPAIASAPIFATDGTSERADLRGRWRFAEGLALDFGAEREWLRFSNSSGPLHRTATSGAYLQLDYGAGPFQLAAGMRRDEHRDFGGEWSFGADLSWRIASGWRATASYGEGFKAPTLFQLHSEYGNAALQPERSRSHDIGIGFDPGPAAFKLTAFSRDTTGLVGFVSCFGVTTGICSARPFGTYDNVGVARARGVEAEGKLRFRRFELSAVYTLLDAEDRTAGTPRRGNDLPRRPEHALTLSGDLFPLAGFSIGADLRVVSDSFDDAANRVPLDGYEVMTLRASWDMSANVSLFGRVENLWNESYQTAAGYATPGRGAYLGARARF